MAAAIGHGAWVWLLLVVFLVPHLAMIRAEDEDFGEPVDGDLGGGNGPPVVTEPNNTATGTTTQAETTTVTQLTTTSADTGTTTDTATTTTTPTTAPPPPKSSRKTPMLIIVFIAFVGISLCVSILLFCFLLVTQTRMPLFRKSTRTRKV
jgi:hypothetical protein